MLNERNGAKKGTEASKMNSMSHGFTNTERCPHACDERCKRRTGRNVSTRSVNSRIDWRKNEKNIQTKETTTTKNKKRCMNSKWSENIENTQTHTHKH